MMSVIVHVYVVFELCHSHDTAVKPGEVGLVLLQVSGVAQYLAMQAVVRTIQSLCEKYK